MDVDLARQQWEDGRRRVGRSDPDSPAARSLALDVEIVVAELRRRIGQTFTLEQLAATYDEADEWARDMLYDSRDEGAPPPDTATVMDAAFQQYARGAVDYRP